MDDSRGFWAILALAAAIVAAGMYLLFRGGEPGLGETGPVATVIEEAGSVEESVTPAPVAAPEPSPAVETAAAGGSLACFAYDTFTGAGVAGCRIALATVGETVTGTDGTAFLDAAPGVYDLAITPPPGWVVARRPGRRLTVTVEADAIAVALAEGIVVAGRVINGAGSGVEGADVYLRAGDGFIRGGTTSGAEGAFAVALGTGAEAVRLMARLGARLSEVTEPLAVTGSMDGVELVLSDGEAGAIDGIVVDANGAGVSGVEVTALLTESPFPSDLRAVSGDGGVFLLIDAPPGAYTLSIEGLDGRRREADVAVTVAAGETVRGVRIVYALPEGGVIAGVVVNPEGAPVAGANVDGRSERGRPAGMITGADGRFVLAGLGEGPYRLDMSHPQYRREITGAIEPGGEEIEIVMTPAAAVRGQVVDKATGKPVPFFQAFLTRGSRPEYHPEQIGMFTAFRDPEGRFTLDGLTQSGAFVFVRAWGYEDGSAAVPGGPVVADAELRIELTPAPAVRGIVEDTSGRGVAGALIFSGALPPTWNRMGAALARSGADGVFEIRSLPASTEVLTAFLAGFGPGQAAYTPGASLLRIRLQEGGVLQGRITEGGAAPKGLASVSPRPMSGAMEISFQTNTADDGSYTIPHMPAGEYLLLVMYAPDEGVMKSKESVAVIEAGKTTTLDVDFEAVRAALSGTVTIGGEIAVSGRVAVKVQTAGGAETGGASIEPDGRYRVDGLPPGPAEVRVHGRSASGASVDGHVTTSVIPAADAALLDIDIPEGED